MKKWIIRIIQIIPMMIGLIIYLIILNDDSSDWGAIPVVIFAIVLISGNIFYLLVRYILRDLKIANFKGYTLFDKIYSIFVAILTASSIIGYFFIYSFTKYIELFKYIYPVLICTCLSFIPIFIVSLVARIKSKLAFKNVFRIGALTSIISFTFITIMFFTPYSEHLYSLRSQHQTFFELVSIDNKIKADNNYKYKIDLQGVEFPTYILYKKDSNYEQQGIVIIEEKEKFYSYKKLLALVQKQLPEEYKKSYEMSLYPSNGVIYYKANKNDNIYDEFRVSFTYGKKGISVNLVQTQTKDENIIIFSNTNEDDDLKRTNEVAKEFIDALAMGEKTKVKKLIDSQSISENQFNNGLFENSQLLEYVFFNPYVDKIETVTSDGSISEKYRPVYNNWIRAKISKNGIDYKIDIHITLNEGMKVTDYREDIVHTLNDNDDIF